MSLVEGKDYYLENGSYVLTRTYLLSRGKCCHGGCRHCPYPVNMGRRTQDNESDCVFREGGEATIDPV